MTRQTARRDDLAEAATDYALEHGLIDLSLRPMAAALGTSDRMLLYHFADKDDLVATMLRVANDRSVAYLGTFPPAPDVRTAVLELWRAMIVPPLARCQGMYIEAAALGLLGQEPYATVVREANERWVAACVHYLVGSGCPRQVAERGVTLMDAAFLGFMLDLPLEDGPAALDGSVRDLADAVAAIADGAGRVAESPA
ncbi:MAG: TetR/AcrR family transcriptional regulator [Nocardioidaceae bacterium]